MTSLDDLPFKTQFIDCHCHLADPVFHSDIKDVLHRATESGVVACVVVSENISEFEHVLKMSGEHPGLVYPCLGVHPIQESKSVSKEHLDEAIGLLHKYHKDIVGIGEVGLDFTPWVCKSTEDRLCQKEVLQHQIQVALQYNLPVNVHSRSAARETVQLLKETGVKKALLHNFAGRVSVAMEAVSLGYFLSFPPHIVLKPEKNKLLQQVPLENICMETDSPALGSVKDIRNEPCNIRLVCSHIANLKNVDEAVIRKQTYENACTLFPDINLKSG